jgi:hypothetical protein
MEIKKLKRLRKVHTTYNIIIDHNFGEIDMCLNDKLSHNIKIKSRNAELFILKKHDFLKLSLKFKEIIHKFLYYSLLKYIHFNDEKKKIMTEWEEKYGNKEPQSKENVASLEQIKEETDDEGEVHDINQTYRSRSHSEDDDKNHDSDNDKNNSDNNVDGEMIYRKQVKSILKTEREGKPQNKKLSFAKNKLFDLSGPQHANYGDTRKKSMISKTPLDTENKTDLKTTLQPILEMNDHVEKVKTDLFKKFAKKIEKIMEFLQMNNIKFENVEKDKNPLTYLKKLQNTREISERNEIIEQLEIVMSKYY